MREGITLGERKRDERGKIIARPQATAKNKECLRKGTQACSPPLAKEVQKHPPIMDRVRLKSIWKVLEGSGWGRGSFKQSWWLQLPSARGKLNLWETKKTTPKPHSSRPASGRASTAQDLRVPGTVPLRLTHACPSQPPDVHLPDSYVSAEAPTRSIISQAQAALTGSPDFQYSGDADGGGSAMSDNHVMLSASD